MAMTGTVRIAEIHCRWYGSFHTQTVCVILIVEGGTDDGYELALVARFWQARRHWSPDMPGGGPLSHLPESREHLGAGQARDRVPNAVERTTQFALYCYTIIALWYTLHSRAQADVIERRLRQPWCTAKAEPAFAGMTADLRRVIVAARFSPAHPRRSADRYRPHQAGENSESRARRADGGWRRASARKRRTCFSKTTSHASRRRRSRFVRGYRAR
jgi:hypothetical protein